MIEPCSIRLALWSVNLKVPIFKRQRACPANRCNAASEITSSNLNYSVRLHNSELLIYHLQMFVTSQIRDSLDISPTPMPFAFKCWMHVLYKCRSIFRLFLQQKGFFSTSYLFRWLSRLPRRTFKILTIKCKLNLKQVTVKQALNSYCFL